MKLFLPHPLSDKPETLIRRAGYAEHRDSHSTQISYTHRLGPEFYPRFHVYLEASGGGVSFDLHIDQKKPSYGAGHAHSGEYEGPLVEREIGRIRDFISNYKPAPQEEKKKGFFSGFFGSED